MVCLGQRVRVRVWVRVIGLVYLGVRLIYLQLIYSIIGSFLLQHQIVVPLLPGGFLVVQSSVEGG